MPEELLLGDMEGLFEFDKLSSCDGERLFDSERLSEDEDVTVADQFESLTASVNVCE
jgi:hypothetical protein